jgi:tetratricopeptide (TPR) repeat protein
VARGQEASEPTLEQLFARSEEAFRAERLQEARAGVLEILARDPRSVGALRRLGQIELMLDHDAVALENFRAAVALEPDSAGAAKDLGMALAQTGDLVQGERMLRRAIALRPDFLEAHYFLSMLKRFSADDPDLAALERIAADEETLETRDAIQLGFAMAKALSDVGDYGRAFAFLQRANARRRSTIDYDVDADLRFMERVREVFDVDLLQRAEGHGSPTERPVLILGMPRSGSTLVEQIISSHPAVRAGGERTDLGQIAGGVQLLGDSQSAFPDGVADLPSEFLAGMGAGYSRRLEMVAGEGAARVTDKTLFNFAYVGMARMIAPRAHVIHCIRNPLDSCVSAFSLDFAHVRFAFDLEELGRFYAAYLRLMDHWRTVLPAGWMLEVRYEELVDDLEGVSRRMIAHCGLEWDDRCLRFQDADRAVRTASFAQVRRPISRGSVGRWRRYEPYLGPLLAALAR